MKYEDVSEVQVLRFIKSQRSKSLSLIPNFVAKFFFSWGSMQYLSFFACFSSSCSICLGKLGGWALSAPLAVVDDDEAEVAVDEVDLTGPSLPPLDTERSSSISRHPGSSSFSSSFAADSSSPFDDDDAAPLFVVVFSPLPFFWRWRRWLNHDLTYFICVFNLINAENLIVLNLNWVFLTLKFNKLSDKHFLNSKFVTLKKCFTKLLNF